MSEYVCTYCFRFERWCVRMCKYVCSLYAMCASFILWFINVIQRKVLNLQLHRVMVTMCCECACSFLKYSKATKSQISHHFLNISHPFSFTFSTLSFTLFFCHFCTLPQKRVIESNVLHWQEEKNGLRVIKHGTECIVLNFELIELLKFAVVASVV